MSGPRPIAILLVAFAAFACTPAPAAAPSPTPAPARSLAGEPMRECFVDITRARCGSLLVPVDRSRPDGRRIDLRVAVVPATSTDARSALLLITGGPGGASTISFGWALQAFADLRTTHDFVLVDQRGTGGSDQLRVPARPELTGLSGASRSDAIAAWLRPAFVALPDDVRFYTSRATADDLDAVREALGYPTVDVYGVSYGATVAQYYARQFPDRVRAIVLDGATLLDVPIMERVALNVQRALELMFARCEREAACANAYPDLRGEFAQVMARLAERPVDTGIVGPAGQPGVIDAPLFASAIHSALISERTVAQLPYRIHLAYTGRWDELVRAALADAAGAAAVQELAMSFVIRCAEPWARFDPEEIARLTPPSFFDRETQIAWARDQAEACRWVPRGVVKPGDEGPLVTSAPVLLLVGEADPQDPIENVAGARSQLPSSTIVVVPGQGHSVAQIGCVGTIVSAFVKADRGQDVDTSCIARGGAPVTPFRLP